MSSPAHRGPGPPGARRSGLPGGLRSRAAAHLRKAALPYAVLALALAFTLLAWEYVRQNLEERDRDLFRNTVSAAELAVERRTRGHILALYGARALFIPGGEVDARDWERYVRSVRLRERFGGLLILGYAPRAPGGRERFPVRLAGPEDEAGRLLLGYDPYADPEHRAAMERARDGGVPQATGMVYVPSEAPPGSVLDILLRRGFYVYLPVYRGGEDPGSPADRRRALEGFVVGIFEMEGLMRGIFRGDFAPAVDLEVYDGGRTSPEALLYDGDGVLRASDPSAAPRFAGSSRLSVGGRRWTLFSAALPGFAGGDGALLPPLVLAVGGATGGLLFGATWLLASSRLRAQAAGRKLEEANRELEAFSYSVSHDLRAPLRSIEGFSQILLEDYGERLDAEGRDYLNRVRRASQRMALLIDALLGLSRLGRREVRLARVDLSRMAREIVEELRQREPGREVEVRVEDGLEATADPGLVKVALENLLGNAWKFTAREERAVIEFGRAVREREPGRPLSCYYVRDNGVGFDMAYAGKLFGPFQRLHTEEEFEGTGVGLATVWRVVRRHGGVIWAEAAEGEGAAFYFTLSP
ncbi:histidine kinase [Rubrobacter xylanophilus DSM 9941]|uniref:Sensor-like histidine kinase SenX3 n=1 Tax=Rubrobacter xylanophilus (strain DSM 9941 / JCM 11954 / NBRC 16129 / PRD-1) TaxID=266117 RepID=Q1AZA0_RUBXD|nr:CHASE domain-containing protein [Rubrobacter xylanophilus]ABG03278.1 histidine kinase [Rubrobacter xylanophilus DSM 9941]